MKVNFVFTNSKIIAANTFIFICFLPQHTDLGSRSPDRNDGCDENVAEQCHENGSR